MNNKITRESWIMIATSIIDIVNDGRDYGNDDLVINDLEELLTDEGIITVIND